MTLFPISTNIFVIHVHEHHHDNVYSCMKIIIITVEMCTLD